MLTRARWRIFLALLLITAVTVWTAFLFIRDDRLHIYYFDIGQGDSILVRKGTFELLIDGGPDEKILEHLGRTLPPWDRTIEIIALTHPHADHVTGLLEVLKRYEIGEIWGTGVLYPTQIYISFLSEIRNRNIPFLAVQAGDSRIVENVGFTILYPFQSLVARKTDNPNASSVVIKLTTEKFSALFTGDLEEDGQRALVENNTNLAATVLKIPHQGSRDADLPLFLQRVKPSLAILSVGRKNKYGHPHIEVIRAYTDMGTVILRTDRDGTIHLSVSDDTLWIKTEKTGIFEEVSLSDHR